MIYMGIEIYGVRRTPVNIDQSDLTIHLSEQVGNLLYKRSSPDGSLERVLLGSSESILLNPVEPINTPKQISHYLLIEFSKDVVVAPNSRKSIYVKFPVEIGVFLPRDDGHDLIDIISLSRKKLTLYGTPRKGHVARYWQTEIFATVPEADPLREGVLLLEIKNESDNWVPVKRAVFEAYGMKIYYKDGLVSAQARMTVLSEKKAETRFITSPLEKGMQRSVELFRSRKLTIADSSYYMDKGL
jgi:hypothetical protein